MIHRTVPMIVRAIGLARLPTMRRMLDDVIGLIDDLKQIFPAPPGV